MNGWHRLWVLLFVIYGVVVAVATYHSIENTPLALRESSRRFVSEETQKAMDYSGTSFSPKYVDPRDAYVLAGFDMVLSNSVNESVFKGVPLEFPSRFKSQERIAILEELYGAASKDTRKLHIESIEVGFAAWLVPSFLVLAIGHGIAWVRRGFKKRS